MFEPQDLEALATVEFTPIVPKDDIIENSASNDTTGFTGDPALDWALQDPEDHAGNLERTSFFQEQFGVEPTEEEYSFLQNNEPSPLQQQLQLFNSGDNLNNNVGSANDINQPTSNQQLEPVVQESITPTNNPIVRQPAAKQVNNSNLPGAGPVENGNTDLLNPNMFDNGTQASNQSVLNNDNSLQPFGQNGFGSNMQVSNQSMPNNSINNGMPSYGHVGNDWNPYSFDKPIAQPYILGTNPNTQPMIPNNKGFLQGRGQMQSAYMNMGGYLPMNNASPHQQRSPYGQPGYVGPSTQNSGGYSLLGHPATPVQNPAQNFGSLPQSSYPPDGGDDLFSSKYLPYDLESLGKSPDLGTQNGGSENAGSSAIDAVLEDLRKAQQNGSPSRTTQASRNGSSFRVTKPRSNHSHGSSPARNGSPSSSRNQPRQTTSGNGISGSPRGDKGKPATYQDTSGFINYNYDDFHPSDTYHPNPDHGFSERPNNPNLNPLKAEHTAISEQPIFPQFQGFFANAEEARAHRKKTRIPPKQASDLQKVKTEGEGYWIYRIYQSMIDISYLRDTEHSIHVKRFTRADGKAWDARDLEAAAFHVFESAIKVYEKGWTHPEVFHTEHKRGKKKDESTTIEQRLESICVALRIAKACVDDALRGGLNLSLLCDNPVARQFTKESNNAGNSARSERLKLAKKVAKKGKEGEEGEEVEEGEEGVEEGVEEEEQQED